MPREYAVPTIDIVQLIVNQRQRKRKIAAALVFVQVTESFNRLPRDFAAVWLKTYYIVLCHLRFN